MDILSMAGELLAAPIIVAISGATFFARNWMKKMEKYKAGLPGWFLVIPGALGFVGGFMFFYGMTPMEVLQAEPWWRNLLQAIIRGGLYFGGSVLLWEKILKKYVKDVGSDDPPGPLAPVG